MSSIFTRKTALYAVIAFALMLAGCFVIVSVTQPSTALGGEQITATVQVTVEGTSDANPHYGIAGLLLPNGWTVDSVYFTGAYQDYMTFLHPDSSDAEPGGQVDYWADELETRYPSGSDMEWAVYQSSQSHAVLADTVDVTLHVIMTASMTQGSFDLGYFVTDAALDFSDPSYYDIELGNSITISGFVPVELTSFAAAAVKEGVQLKWETASELNNTGFEIQRSVDGNAFNKIGFVPGHGTTTEKQNYSYIDDNVAGGKYFYRLKQIDTDGTFELSKAIEVDFSIPEDYAVKQNYPNPFNPTTAIEFALPVDAKVVVAIYNTLGEKISVLADQDFSAGRHLLNLDASKLSSGTYIYSITAEGTDGSSFTQSRKMILMR